MFADLCTDFIGLDTHYTTADGVLARRRYLDSNASTLMMRSAYEAAGRFLAHYANSHSHAHHAAEISSEALRWAQQRVLRFVGADEADYACVFVGSGATAGMNRLARRLPAARPERPVMLVSAMEHHSSDLPYRCHASCVESMALARHSGEVGGIDLDALDAQLARLGERVNSVVATGVSNVTGIINPVHAIAERAHRHGALMVLDAAQMVAHMPVCLSQGLPPAQHIDACVFSGHKAYAPGSPGVLVIKKERLARLVPDDWGGGMVAEVNAHSYRAHADLAEREMAGTPNIVGALTLAYALEQLDRVGMATIERKQRELTARLHEGLRAIEGVEVYGSHDLVRYPRVGAVAFNLVGWPHGLVARVLNDAFNIAVRNGCFCAHPYVHQLLAHAWQRQPMPGDGMVRASLGLYSTPDDIEALLHACRTLLARPGVRHEYAARYRETADGGWVLIDAALPTRFHPLQALGARQAAG